MKDKKHVTFILYSQKADRFYVGSGNTVKEHLKRHNSAKHKMTRFGIPWEVVYSIDCPNQEAAVKLEHKIRKAGARKYLIDIEFFPNPNKG